MSRSPKAISSLDDTLEKDFYSSRGRIKPKLLQEIKFENLKIEKTQEDACWLLSKKQDDVPIKRLKYIVIKQSLA